MRKRMLLAILGLIVLMAIVAPVAIAYYDGGGSDGGWVQPQAVLCYYDGGGSDGG